MNFQHADAVNSGKITTQYQQIGMNNIYIFLKIKTKQNKPFQIIPPL